MANIQPQFVGGFNGPAKRTLIEGTSRDGRFKKGDVVCAKEFPYNGVLFEIVEITWAMPPEEGGIAKLKFWGSTPDLDPSIQKRLDQRDLKNDIFGSYLADLGRPENGLEVLAISSQDPA